MRASLKDDNVPAFLFLYQLGDRVTLYDDPTHASVGVIVNGVCAGGARQEITYTVKRETNGTSYHARERDIRRGVE